MPQETREEMVARLIEKHTRDRNMDPNSITGHYSITDVGIELDPEFFEARLSMGWGFFRDEPRQLDHITRNLLISVFLAHRDRPGCYHQGKKAVMMGATYNQMLEGYAAGHTVGGGPVLMNGMYAIRRMQDEGIEPGCQPGRWTNHWVRLGPWETPAAAAAVNDDAEGAVRGTDGSELDRQIDAYYPAEDGGSELGENLKFGAGMDPEFFQGYANLVWGVFDRKTSYLDPIRREMATLVILAWQGRSRELYLHCLRARRLGATMAQLLEVFEASFTGAGSRVVLEGLGALRTIHENEQELGLTPSSP